MNRFAVIIFVVIAALLAAMGSVYVVNESQTAIVLNLGRVVRADIQPGLHFKWPLVEEVRKFDQRILSLDDQPERYLTSEKKDVSVDFFVKWRIQDVATYYRAASGGSEEAARQRLTPIVKNALRNEINQRTLQEVVSAGRAELSGAFLKKVNESARSLGVEVVDVRIKRINLPDDSNILTTVYSRMRTERTQVANQLRAEGVELSETIRSEADRQRVVTVAEAERDAQKLRGEGDARAAEIAAAAYGGDPEFYAFYRSLELYRNAMADGQTVLVLDPDSEFLRYMENSGR
ncbi:protein HflC [Arenimonas soli]|uniref:Protein HflC n=1 Tax=Arenimonas soli TaxID=2269504 RepID=A0ABQ1HDT7_9GAMM|nr:protease modulator HflC [Arenimonas soli]GGA70548.1 protein HflC [Arenimonas soli]